jgi:hypothetical protein
LDHDLERAGDDANDDESIGGHDPRRLAHRPVGRHDAPGSIDMVFTDAGDFPEAQGRMPLAILRGAVDGGT